MRSDLKCRIRLERRISVRLGSLNRAWSDLGRTRLARPFRLQVVAELFCQRKPRSDITRICVLPSDLKSRIRLFGRMVGHRSGLDTRTCVRLLVGSDQILPVKTRPLGNLTPGAQTNFQRCHILALKKMQMRQATPMCGRP